MLHRDIHNGEVAERPDLSVGMKTSNDSTRKETAKPECALPSASGSGSAYLKTLTEGLEDKPCFERLEDCYQQGRAAWSQSYSRTHNPYEEGTARREWWDSGWCNQNDELCGER